jgi:adenylyl- and sulfurtransferase ThiI
VVVETSDPVGAAAALCYVPGVAWVAVGFTFPTLGEAGKAAGLLAKRYVKAGGGFTVDGEGTGGTVGGDVAGAVTSGILEMVKGSRVSASAKVRFRAASDGKRGVVGVEVAEGPGGASTGDLWASCLVSGGRRSSVLAWCALLSGYRVSLMHVRTSERSVLAVGRLYAELCRRAGPRALTLTVKEGGTTQDLVEMLKASGGEAFGGFSAGAKAAPRGLARTVTSPLYLMPEEQMKPIFDSLHLTPDDSEYDWESIRTARISVKRFDGWADDVSAVLDGLR